MRREVQGSSSRLGYRGMWYLLLVSYGITTPRNVVMRMLRELDPAATEARRSKQLKRRRCKSDGYDKLKPYRLSIHGAVDSFSGKILRLEVCKSNNNPINPNLLRIDTGTENGLNGKYTMCAERKHGSTKMWIFNCN